MRIVLMIPMVVALTFATSCKLGLAQQRSGTNQLPDCEWCGAPEAPLA